MKKRNEKRIKPIEHMKSAEDEFIAHMREQLSNHEEAYLPGAWERFNQKEGKSAVALWPRYAAAAAAVLLIGFGIALYQNQYTSDQPAVIVQVKTKKAPKAAAPSVTITDPEPGITSQNPSHSSNTEGVPANDIRPSANSIALENKLQRLANLSGSKELPSANQSKNISSLKDENTAGNIVSTKNINTQDSALVASVNETKSPVTAAQKKESPKQSFEDFLKEESIKEKALATKKTKKGDKWEMGIMVAPSFGNAKRLNMGYGLSMAYALSDKVSISSGLAYNEMGTSKGIASPSSMNSPSTVALASSSRSLQSVDARLTGIDIPLEIKYRFSKKLYANAGLSAFAVLNQTQKNNFIENNVEAQLAGFSNGNESVFRTVVVSRKVSEEAPEEEVKEEQYLGFYNFSFGYQQKVFGGRTFAIEPFVKLPVKQFSRDHLNLIGTGVKLKFNF